MAGVSAVLAAHPLDLLRTHLALRANDNAGGYLAVARRLLASDAVALSRGAAPALLGAAVYKASGFLAYEVAHSRSDALANWPYARESLSAALATLLGQLLAYPLDVVKRNTMVGAAPRGVLSSARAICAREGGVRGLYKGVALNFVKAPLAAVVTFTVRRYLNTAAAA